jgi:hypothetical protein
MDEVPVVIDKRGHVHAKLFGRKVREWVVTPRSTQVEEDRIVVQSMEECGCIAMFDPSTGKGVLNRKGGYFIHLHGLGVEPFEFPQSFVSACMRVQKKPGEAIVPGVLYAGGELPHDVKVVE